MSQLSHVIASLLHEHQGEKAEARQLAKDIQARVLVDMLPTVVQACPFKVGDVVQQRANGCAVYAMGAGQLGIVSHVFDQQLLAAGEKGMNLRDDMMILLQADGELWVEMCVSSWRFEKYAGEIAT